MIIQERIDEDSIRQYSDRHVYIHGGFPEADYEDAIDPAELVLNGTRVYTETDIPIRYEIPAEDYEE